MYIALDRTPFHVQYVVEFRELGGRRGKGHSAERRLYNWDQDVRCIVFAWGWASAFASPLLCSFAECLGVFAANKLINGTRSLQTCRTVVMRRKKQGDVHTWLLFCAIFETPSARLLQRDKKDL